MYGALIVCDVTILTLTLAACSFWGLKFCFNSTLSTQHQHYSLLPNHLTKADNFCSNWDTDRLNTCFLFLKPLVKCKLYAGATLSRRCTPWSLTPSTNQVGGLLSLPWADGWRHGLRKFVTSTLAIGIRQGQRNVNVELLYPTYQSFKYQVLTD